MTRRLSAALAGLSVLLMLLVAVGPSPSVAQVEEFESYSAGSELTEAHADVFRLYWAFFDREPDVGGAQYWVGQNNQCATLLDITWSFSNSPEFFQRYGSLSNEDYVTLVYNNVLDRAPDLDGMNYWLDLLRTGELIQPEVMLYFSLSPEFRGQHPLPSDGRPAGSCTAPADVYYKNCDDVRANGAAPILQGEPGYRSGLDRDGDGVGCEN